jgi:hypothetical protein
MVNAAQKCEICRSTAVADIYLSRILFNDNNDVENIKTFKRSTFSDHELQPTHHIVCSHSKIVTDIPVTNFSQFPDRTTIKHGAFYPQIWTLDGNLVSGDAPDSFSISSTAHRFPASARRCSYAIGVPYFIFPGRDGSFELHA